MAIDVREHYKTLQCATCMISCGCTNCIRGDDLAEIYELRAMVRSLIYAAEAGCIAWMPVVDRARRLLDGETGC